MDVSMFFRCHSHTLGHPQAQMDDMNKKCTMFGFVPIVGD
jgi:hypothetical protein